MKRWADVVSRVRGLPGATEDTLVCSYAVAASGKLATLSAEDLIGVIRHSVAALGRASLGFGPEDVGTHSIRSGAAMAMHLASVPVHTIMLIGRWESDAFMAYLRAQVLQFTQSVSSKMVSVNHFFHVPSWGSHGDSPSLRSSSMVGGAVAPLPEVPHCLDF